MEVNIEAVVLEMGYVCEEILVYEVLHKMSERVILCMVCFWLFEKIM